MADPEALIIHSETDRPDLVGLAYQSYCEFQAEEVVCISNPKVTRLIVYEMGKKGVYQRVALFLTRDLVKACLRSHVMISSILSIEG